MLLSSDRKNIYLGITKTGTHTVRNCLESVSTKIAKPGQHPTFYELTTHKNFETDVISQEEIATCNFYAIWRDPVERFASAVSFVKRKAVGALMFMLPEKFPDSIIPQNNWLVDYSTLPENEQKIIDTIELNDVISKLSVTTVRPYIVFQKQSQWLVNVPNLNILSFANFDNSVRTLYTTFGGTDASNLVIPKLNSSPNFPLENCDSKTRQMIMDYYAEDYSLSP
jgi:hypothetical protein